MLIVEENTFTKNEHQFMVKKKKKITKLNTLVVEGDFYAYS